MPDPTAPRPRRARTLNLGVLAHIDAGKTSLTERLLYDNGAIPALGSVDAGSTRTDTGELERERGITIRSAVAAFTTRGLQVNLVDTPGHPDFIAEVERALSVLDGAVLVVSAVEGVQAQTRVLMRSLRAFGLPTLVFVNKVDRGGARPDRVLDDIRARLAPYPLPLSTVTGPGTPHARVAARPWEAPDLAETLAEHDDRMLARLVEGRPPGPGTVRRLIARQTAAGQVFPVFHGSAVTGAGVAGLTAGIRTLLRPPAAPDAPARGTVFAVERAPGGDRVAYLRLFTGRVRACQRLAFARDGEPGYRGRVTGLDVVTAPGADAPGQELTAGGIARLRGLPGVRVGDRLGGADDRALAAFPPPGLETVVTARDPAHRARLHAALTGLADEDPLIRTRVTGSGDLSVLLYGAVQREVVGERLLRDFGVAADFAPITPVYTERPAGTGEALREMPRFGDTVFYATVGLRVAPGDGVGYTSDVEFGALPRAFHRAVEDTVRGTLRQGLYGWEVADCAVTLTRVGYAAPMTTAADFRGLTPLVLAEALRRAGTRVYEPCRTVEVELPADALSAVTGLLTGLGAELRDAVPRGASWAVTAELPVRTAHLLTARLPGLTRGEGVVWTSPGTDRAVRGRPPRRERTDGDPYRLDAYLRFLANRDLGAPRA